MRLSRKPQSRRRHGVAAIELAFTLPLLLIILTGIWEVGRMVHVKQIVSNAAREGARAASTGSRTYTQVRNIVLNYLDNAGLDNRNVVVEVRNVTTGNSSVSYNPSLASQLDELEVYVSLPFDNVRWAALDQITSLTDIDARVRWYSAKDIPIDIDLSGNRIPGSILK